MTSLDSISHAPKKVLSASVSTHKKIQQIHTSPTNTPASTSTPIQPTDQTSSETIVTYTDDGFLPKTITVKKGDAVYFKNNSSQNMWVASNYFPTSKLYPLTDDSKCDSVTAGIMFDECKGVNNGSIWKFVFNYIGRWPYHNHLYPSHGGTIIVTK